jgi:hypothetical protein
MTTYTINVEMKTDYTIDGYVAVFDGYDGASDSGHPFGTGETELDAIYDLINTYEVQQLGQLRRGK